MGGIDILAAMSDHELARAYRNWSEDMWCAGWMEDHYAEFIRDVATGRWHIPRQVLVNYEAEGIAKIRAALESEHRRDR